MADETAMRAACDQARWDAAATLVLSAYGQELLEYLIAIARSEADGADAFSIFAEKLWRGLPGFRWQSSARTWCYLLARHALADVKRAGPARRAHRELALSDAPGVAALAAQVRTRTLSFLRTEARDALTAVRDSLSAEEQELLILRVDRKLAWREIAQITGDDDLDAAAVERRSAALRKRFETLKARLRDAVGR